MRGSAQPRSLLNRREQLLYGRLVRAFPGHVILSRVELSRLLAADRSAAGDGPAIASRVRQLIADFVVCRADFSAVAVVELDEAEKPRESVVERNRRKDRALQEAGVKVIHLPAHDLPDEAALKALIAAHPLHRSTEQLVRRAS